MKGGCLIHKLLAYNHQVISYKIDGMKSFVKLMQRNAELLQVKTCNVILSTTTLNTFEL